MRRYVNAQLCLEWLRIVAIAALFGFAACVALAIYSLSSVVAWPRDLDGKYAARDPAMHAWFDKLASKNGSCCSFADGLSIADVDWGTELAATGDGSIIRYWVNVYGEHKPVPPEAVITEPNRFGSAVVWPIISTYSDGHKEVTGIRCFMPGAGT